MQKIYISVPLVFHYLHLKVLFYPGQNTHIAIRAPSSFLTSSSNMQVFYFHSAVSDCLASISNPMFNPPP